MNNNKYNLFLFLLIFSLLSFSSKEIKIEELINSHILESGGEELLKSIKTIDKEEILYSKNMEIPQSAKIIINEALYQETTFPNSKMIVALKDNKGWQINPYKSKTAVDLNEKEVSYFNIFTRFLTPISDYGINKNDSYIKDIELLEGNHKVEGTNCYKLKVTYKTNYIEHLFVSKKNSMVLKIENSFGSTVFSNFKKVDGILIPHSYFLKNTRGIMEIDLISIKINSKINDDIFLKK